MKGFVQVLQVLLFFVAAIIAISILIDNLPQPFCRIGCFGSSIDVGI